LSSVLRPLQHSIGYMGDGFYRSKDPTNSIKVLKEEAVKENNQGGATPKIFCLVMMHHHECVDSRHDKIWGAEARPLG